MENLNLLEFKSTLCVAHHQNEGNPNYSVYHNRQLPLNQIALN